MLRIDQIYPVIIIFRNRSKKLFHDFRTENIHGVEHCLNIPGINIFCRADRRCDPHHLIRYHVEGVFQRKMCAAPLIFTHQFSAIEHIHEIPGILFSCTALCKELEKSIYTHRIQKFHSLRHLAQRYSHLILRKIEPVHSKGIRRNI